MGTIETLQQLQIESVPRPAVNLSLRLVYTP